MFLGLEEAWFEEVVEEKVVFTRGEHGTWLRRKKWQRNNLNSEECSANTRENCRQQSLRKQTPLHCQDYTLFTWKSK
jgi:hypothetical protein